jgi:hypothetical protein
MNKTNYKQYDTRWAKLGYPKSPYFIRDCGCGEVAVCNCIIEMQKYAKETPKTIQPYCKQYAEPHGNGTYFSGIPKMMEHYGLTEVKEHQTMDSLWKELKKGDRVAIYLMGSRKGGSKGVHWTSSAHFVCSTGYKVKDGKHYVYVKDSYSTSEQRNGWISYEGNMRNDVSRVWSGKLNGTLYTKPKSNRQKIADCGWKFAYHSNTSKAKYPSGEPKPAYKEALDKYFGKTRKWHKSAKVGASCDVFVATCIRAAGVDKNAPRGLGRSYFDKSDKFKRVKVTYKTIKDGDIISINWKNGNPHWAMAYDGKVLEASLNGWFPKVTNTLKSRLSKSGKQSVVVYRAK